MCEQVYDALLNSSGPVRVDQFGQPKQGFPCVQLIPKAKGCIEVIASRNPAYHPWRVELHKPSQSAMMRVLHMAWEQANHQLR